MTPHYSMIIRWSDEDQAYLVMLPELYGEGRYCTHGETYEEAAKNGREVMEMLLEDYEETGRPLPEPAIVAPVRAG
jgi:predicted RNase H-like HicB family nuclease